MAEEIKLTSETKEGKYKELLVQIEALLAGEGDQVANMANVAAAIKFGMDFFWVGFYMVRPVSKNNSFQLVLGPFQGPVACTRIDMGKGVCGTAWHKKQTLIVDNVNEFPGHIACSALSKSEIVVPLFDQAGSIYGVLDIDSDQYKAFDATDAAYLEQICKLLKQ